MSSKPKGSFHRTITNKQGVEIKLLFTVLTECPACEKSIKNRTRVIAVGAPHFVILHEDCYHQYDFNRPYPHGEPLCCLPTH